MRKTISLVASVLSLAAAPTLAQAPPAPAPVRAPVVHCQKPSQVDRFARHALRFWIGGHGGDYHASTPTKAQLAKAGGMRACAKANNRIWYRLELRFWHARTHTWRFYRHIDQITPYGEFVTPYNVPQHESSTSGWYHAYNHGGCGGPGCIGVYQIGADHWNTVCRGLPMWPPWAQHECALRVENSEGLTHAWAADF